MNNTQRGAGRCRGKITCFCKLLLFNLSIKIMTAAGWQRMPAEQVLSLLVYPPIIRAGFIWQWGMGSRGVSSPTPASCWVGHSYPSTRRQEGR